MTKYILTTSTASVLSLAAVLLVVIKLDPFSTPGLALTLFYLSLFLTLTGIFTIFGFYTRKYLIHGDVSYNYINVSVRQAILLSICTIGFLIFQMLGVLTWWDGTLLIGIILLLEFYFSSQQ